MKRNLKRFIILGTSWKKLESSTCGGVLVTELEVWRKLEEVKEGGLREGGLPLLVL